MTTAKLYTYAELPEKIQERILFDYLEYDDGAWLTETFNEILEERGLPAQVEYSLGWQQGDGVAFYGDCDLSILLPIVLDGPNYDRHRRLLVRLKELGWSVDVTIQRNRWGNWYSHAYTMTAVLDTDYGYYTMTSQLPAFKDIEEAILAYAQDTSRELERLGYKLREENHYQVQQELLGDDTPRYTYQGHFIPENERA